MESRLCTVIQLRMCLRILMRDTATNTGSSTPQKDTLTMGSATLATGSATTTGQTTMDLHSTIYTRSAKRRSSGYKVSKLKHLIFQLHRNMLLLFTAIQAKAELGPPFAPYFCTWVSVLRWRIVYDFTGIRDSQTAKAWVNLVSCVTSITLRGSTRNKSSLPP